MIRIHTDPDPDPDPDPKHCSKVKIWILGVKSFFMQFLVDILPFGPGSVDPHIFADPDLGSQNLGNPTYPDPKHCLKVKIKFLWETFFL